MDDNKKPKPEDLGSGTAKAAAEKLSGRAAQIEAAVSGAVKPKPKKRKFSF